MSSAQNVNIVPLYAAPQHAEQVTDWLWQAFGASMPRAFFASIVTHVRGA